MKTFKTGEGFLMKFFIFCVLSVTSLFIIDCRYYILPIHGLYLFFYIATAILLSIWITSKLVQNLLKETRPINFKSIEQKGIFQRVIIIGHYLVDVLKKAENTTDINTEQISTISSKVLIRQDEIDAIKYKEAVIQRESSIDERIFDFVSDIQSRFLNNWYAHISADQAFLNESEKLLDEVVRRFLQVIVQIDHKKLVHSTFVVFLKHAKEFKKTVKRSEKSGLSIEECFRYSHVASNNEEAFQYYVHQITSKVLKQFVSSELCNSLLWRTLVSILSRKLTTNILLHISQPGFINYKIVYNCANEKDINAFALTNKAYISLSDVNLTCTDGQKSKIIFLNSKEMLKIKKENLELATTPKISPKRTIPTMNRIPDEVDGFMSKIQEEKKDENAPKEDKKSERAVSEPVKIYESSSNKTWRNSSDLESISFGEDLLAFEDVNDADSQIQNLIEKKLWKDSTEINEPEEKSHHSIWNIPENWFGEETHDDIKDISPNIHAAAQIITNTIKPIGNVTDNTIHNMKEFEQMTVNAVNSARHKIEDLQDEAAGVMEGILDFGIAGIRKGLRLTGLQEPIHDLTQKSKIEIHKIQKTLDAKANDVLKNIECTQKPSKPPKLTKEKNITSEDVKIEERTSSNESDDSNIWLNPLNVSKESPSSFEGHILLEKTPLTPKSFVQDVARRLSKDYHKPTDIPQIAMEANSTHISPDLEYEDTTDLATTTAKLRSLLQQRTSESNITTPALSPMPQDENIKITTPLEPAELADVDGVMPSLYKFYNKTATGLQNTFNTIKTALPGTEKTPDATNIDNIGEWAYSYDKSKDFQYKMEKLLYERRDYCTVDPAYDYLEIMDRNDGSWMKNNVPFEDDLEEFEYQIPISKAAFDIFCELISDTNSALTQEPVVKSLLLLFGNKSEEILENMSGKMVKNVKNLIGKLPQNQNDAPAAMKLQEMVDIIYEKLPKTMKDIIGKETVIHGLNLFIKMMQSQKINLDLTLQLFEVISTELIQANNLMSPAYSA